MKRNVLKFKVSVKPLSPVHIGVGNIFLSRSAFHLYDSDRSLALLKVRPLAERLVDQYGHETNLTAKIQSIMQRGDYPPAIARDIESGKLSLRRMKVHPGAKPHLGEGLKELMALANGLPYIPGSSLKGALRTVWLDWQTQPLDAYDRFVAEVKRTDLRKRDRTDDAMMERKQVAEKLLGASSKMQPQNRDLFRAVQVSDLLPDKTQDLTRVYAVLSMSYQAESHARPSNGGKAGAQAWECLSPDADATYSGTVTVDLDLLKRMQMQDRDARNLAEGLAQASGWRDALAGYGERVYGTEDLHYEMLSDLPEQGRKGIQLWGEGGLLLDWIRAKAQANAAEQLLPLGMGTGLLAHSLLGVLVPEDRGDDLAFLGDEQGHSETRLKEVLDTGLKRPASAYHTPEFPAPKSRRVTGIFGGRIERDMQAERPLGWTATTLEHLPE